MENTRQLNPDTGSVAWVDLIEKVHKCANCPIRKMGVKQPQSIFARLHSWHKSWWPGWKAHQVKTCAFAARVNSHEKIQPGQ